MRNRRFPVAFVAVFAAAVLVASAGAGSESVRGCESRVESGQFRSERLPDGWRRFGPIALAWRAYAGSPGSDFEHVPGRPRRYYAQKFLVLVRAGMVARLVVPRWERTNVSLLYDPARWDRPSALGFGIREGEPAVTFRACRPSEPSWLATGGTVGAWTEFNGGLLVAGARCVSLTVYRSSGRPPVTRIPVSFGAGHCA